MNEGCCPKRKVANIHLGDREGTRGGRGGCEVCWKGIQGECAAQLGEGTCPVRCRDLF